MRPASYLQGWGTLREERRPRWLKPSIGQVWRPSEVQERRNDIAGSIAF